MLPPARRPSTAAPSSVGLVNLPYVVLALLQATCICSALFRPNAPAHYIASASSPMAAAVYTLGLLALAAWLRRRLAGDR